MSNRSWAFEEILLRVSMMQETLDKLERILTPRKRINEICRTRTSCQKASSASCAECFETYKRAKRMNRLYLYDFADELDEFESWAREDAYQI